MLVQVAWYGHDKVTQNDRENGPVNGADHLSAGDGTQLINAVDDSELSSDDELFGLLDKSADDRRVTNGNYTVLGNKSRVAKSHGVQQYVGNMSSMLSGINVNRSTIVQWC